jgi:glycerol-3-phosphate dehydrogenase
MRLKAGLFIYDLLAGMVHSAEAHRYYAKAAFLQRYPCLDSKFLTCGFSYLDAQTDDARLVLELIDGAQQAGAVCLNYCKLSGIREQQGHINAVKLLELVNGAEAEVATRHVIGTTGPWLAASERRLTKGVHLVLPKLLGDEALLLTAKSDGRVFFIMPWYGLTLLGTTDSDYNGDIDRVCVDAEEVDYLLSEANRALKTVQWTERDIIGRFAGLRVLQPSSHKTPSAISRDWALKQSDNGFLTSIGGKITSARADAAHIIDKLCEQVGNDAPSQTNARPFPWAPMNYRQWASVESEKARQLGVDEEASLWLLRRHGIRVESIFGNIAENPRLSKRIIPSAPFIKAELAFCAANEMVVHLDDLLRRRMPLMILAKLTVDDLRNLAAGIAGELNWDSATTNNEIDRCLQIGQCR